jgi:hypothetical protein
MSPRDTEGSAGLGDGLGEDDVSKERSGAIGLAGVDVGFSCISCRIEDEGGSDLAKGLDDGIKRGEVQFTAPGSHDLMTPGLEFMKELRTHIAVGSQQEDAVRSETHGAMK